MERPLVQRVVRDVQKTQVSLLGAFVWDGTVENFKGGKLTKLSLFFVYFISTYFTSCPVKNNAFIQTTFFNRKNGKKPFSQIPYSWVRLL